MRDVVLHSLLGQEQALTDLPVGQPLPNQRHDLALLGGQTFQSVRCLVGGVPQSIKDACGAGRVKQGAPCRHGAHGAHEVGAVDLLENIARGPGENRLEERLIIGEGSEHQTAHLRHLGADVAAYLDPGTVRESDVKNRHMRLDRLDAAQCRFSSGGLSHHLDVASSFEKCCDTTTDDLVVVKQEDADRVGSSHEANAIGRHQILGPRGPKSRCERMSSRYFAGTIGVCRDKVQERFNRGEWGVVEMAETAQRMVVVGVDGSAPSGKAVDWAAQEAARRGVDLHIEFVVDQPTLAIPFAGLITYVDPGDLRDYGATVLDAASDRATRVEPGLQVRTHVLVGSTPAELVKAGADADLVVVGSRGLGSVGSAVFGSVSTRLAARSTTPVVVIPADMPTVEHHGEVEGPIVVGMDGSPHSEAALLFALDEAKLRGCKVIAASAWQNPTAPLWMTDQAFIEEAAEQARKAAAASVEDSLARVRGPQHHAVAVEVVITESQAAPALHALADGAAMTVVGTRGRSDVKGILLGSVSQDVLHHARGPVAIVHAAR